MSRITLKIDSANGDEAWAFVAAFQRTAGIPLPSQFNTLPTVEISGSAFTITTPAMTLARALAMGREFAQEVAR